MILPDRSNEAPASPQEPVPVRVMAALSLPRLAFTDPLFLCMQLVQMNIEVRKHSGAFWEQSLSRLLYQAVEENFDYVLTVDYDSVFKPVDVWHMLQMIHQRPDVAAVFPVQYRREQDQIILGVEGAPSQAPEAPFAEQLLPAVVGHFGLTFLRVASLREIPQPWLHSQPNADGRWEEGRVDADISFWRALSAQGLTACCATRVVIGHIQQMITWPGEDYQPVHQYLTRYFDDGDAPDQVIDAAAARAGSCKPRAA